MTKSLGQHRHLRLAGLSDADQGELPLPRFDSGRAHALIWALSRYGQAYAFGCAPSAIQEWLSFYLKSPQSAPGTLSGARFVHPVDEAVEHAAPHHGVGPDHPPRLWNLRLRDWPSRRTSRWSQKQKLNPSGWGLLLVMESLGGRYDLAPYSRRPLACGPLCGMTGARRRTVQYCDVSPDRNSLAASAM